MALYINVFLIWFWFDLIFHGRPKVCLSSGSLCLLRRFVAFNHYNKSDLWFCSVISYRFVTTKSRWYVDELLWHRSVAISFLRRDRATGVLSQAARRAAVDHRERHNTASPELGVWMVMWIILNILYHHISISLSITVTELRLAYP